MAAKKKKTETTEAIQTADTSPQAITKHEEFDQSDLGCWDDVDAGMNVVPFLQVLQPGSPAIAQGTVDGAKPGMFYNPTSGQLYEADDGPVVVPVGLIHHFVEWTPRSKGGGFVASHNPASPEVDEARRENSKAFGKLTLSNGNEMVESRDVTMAVLSDDGKNFTGEVVILAFKSTALKSVRLWISQLMKVKPKAPYFAFAAKLTTQKKTNNEGTWYVPVASPLEGDSWKASCMSPSSELFQAMRGLAQDYDSAKVAASYKNEKQEESQEGGSGEPPPF